MQIQEQSELVKDTLPYLPRAVDRYKELVKDLPNVCHGGEIAILRDKVSKLLDGTVKLKNNDDSWECNYRGAYSGLLQVGTSRSEISDATL